MGKRKPNKLFNIRIYKSQNFFINITYTPYISQISLHTHISYTEKNNENNYAQLRYDDERANSAHKFEFDILENLFKPIIGKSNGAVPIRPEYQAQK